MSEHPWQSAVNEFNGVVMPALTKHGEQIGMLAEQGNIEARNVIVFYKMLYASFDPVTFILLKDHLRKLNIPCS